MMTTKALMCSVYYSSGMSFVASSQSLLSPTPTILVPRPKYCMLIDWTELCLYQKFGAEHIFLISLMCSLLRSRSGQSHATLLIPTRGWGALCDFALSSCKGDYPMCDITFDCMPNEWGWGWPGYSVDEWQSELVNDLKDDNSVRALSLVYNQLCLIPGATYFAERALGKTRVQSPTTPAHLVQSWPLCDREGRGQVCTTGKLCLTK